MTNTLERHHLVNDEGQIEDAINNLLAAEVDALCNAPYNLNCGNMRGRIL